MNKGDNKKRINFSAIIVCLLLLTFVYSGIETMWGMSYLFKYCTYEHNAWGEITYVSDYIRPNRPYPSRINIQVNLDEPVNGNKKYSITFKKYRKRIDNIASKGLRALVVYNDFYNSDGDVISIIDIAQSVICAIVFGVELLIIIFAFWHYNHKKNKYIN